MMGEISPKTPGLRSTNTVWLPGSGTGSGVGGDGTCIASGSYSLAYGSSSINNAGDRSVSFGNGNTITAASVNVFQFGNGCDTGGNPVSFCIAVGTTHSTQSNYCYAFGRSVTGTSSFCMGVGDGITVAHNSFAFGITLTASGTGCYVLGNNASATNGGSFVFADTSDTGTNTADTGANQFVCRFAGGYYFKVSNTVVGLQVKTTGCSILGTTTNDNATAGYVGELISSVKNTGAAVSFTTATPKDLTSISLTAGDWDVFGNIRFAATTITVGLVWISATSATVPDASLYNIIYGLATSAEMGMSAPYFRATLSGTTTIYISGQANATGTLTGVGGIYARRVR